MRYLRCQQGSPDWYAARAGRITASEFATAISVLSRTSGAKKPGDPTDASDKYAAAVAIERISGLPWGEPIKPWVLQRGHELEPHARLAYEARMGNMAEEAGVCLTEDGIFGYSTDGMVNPFMVSEPGTVDSPLPFQSITGCEGLIEIKCPVDALKILSIWRDGDVSEYWEQMQGGMWITGAKWCDFVMYCPDLKPVGRDVYIQRVARDEAFIGSLERKLIEFSQRVAHYASLLGQERAAAWPFPISYNGGPQ